MAGAGIALPLRNSLIGVDQANKQCSIAPLQMP